jgi:hypothetical protein
MKGKIMGIMVCTLVILATVSLVAGTVNYGKTQAIETAEGSQGKTVEEKELGGVVSKSLGSTSLPPWLLELVNPDWNFFSDPSTGIVYTNECIYTRGNTIYITFLNTGTYEVTLPNTAPWQIEKWLFGWNKVYVPISLQVLVAIPPEQPGGSFVWSWDQKDNEGDLVSVGFFRVALSYYDGIPDSVPLETVYDYFFIT